MPPIVKATFMTRCGCTKELVVSYPPSPQYYFYLKRDPMKMWLQDELAQLPAGEVRTFTLTQYGRVQETDENVLEVLYEEVAEK